MKFKKDFKDSIGDTTKYPQDLIFIQRNMNLIRSINKRMGSLVNRINVMAVYASRGNNQKYAHDGGSYVRELRFRVTLFFSNFVYWVAQTYLRYFKKSSVEEALDNTFKEQINQEF